MSRATDTTSIQASTALSRMASPILSASEHDTIYKAAYNSAFDVSIINNITKKSSKPTMFTNYAIFFAPDAGGKAADKAIAAAIELKTKHVASKAFLKHNKPFNITPIVAKHSSAIVVAKLGKLVTEQDKSLFETVHMMGLHSLCMRSSGD